ncbi:unnamed protein product [Paramecium pentaurelia]|uniref:Rab-family small GTPase n=1 Tax=Paramecium pentaurelia TaxID=43138 RepID=A0A8S1XBD1_9CILI|nr:unnamed protein product [Paramecium pentaurelia]
MHKHNKSNKQQQHKVKITVIGNMGVGKTQLINKFCDYLNSNQYVTSQDIPINLLKGRDFQSKTIVLQNKNFMLNLQDTSGDQKFQVVTEVFIKGANAVIIVFDQHKLSSFQDVKYWIDLVNKIDSKVQHKILIGNKCDLEKQFQENELQQLIEEENLLYYETSVKENINVEVLISRIVELVSEDYPTSDEIQQLSSIILEQHNKSKIRDYCCNNCVIM